MSVLLQGTDFDLSVGLVKVGYQLVVDSEAAICDSCPSLVSLIDSQD